MRKQQRSKGVRVRRSPGVCTAFQARCTVLCPCQASRCDRALSEWLRWLEGGDGGRDRHEQRTGDLFRGCCALRCTQHPPTPHPPQSLSSRKRGCDVPELPDWNIICKQHNWFMTVHHVCPSLMFCFTPAGRFLSLEYISGNVS